VKARKLGQMRGAMTITGDIVAPTEPDGWDIGGPTVDDLARAVREAEREAASRGYHFDREGGRWLRFSQCAICREPYGDAAHVCARVNPFTIGPFTMKEDDMSLAWKPANDRMSEGDCRGGPCCFGDAADYEGDPYTDAPWVTSPDGTVSRLASRAHHRAGTKPNPVDCDGAECGVSP